MRRLLVHLLFLLSGTAGLAYQVVWMRKLTLVLGATSQAVATVLAVFMGGLALGSWLLGRAGDETRSPLRFYGWLELGVALFGVQSLLLLDGLLTNYASILAWAGEDWFPLVRLGLASLALIGPTTLMGATLPVLIAGVCASRERIARDSGLLYGINTLGAVAGVIGTAFFLVPELGLRGTTYVAAGINLFVGLLALILSRSERTAVPRPHAAQLDPAAALPEGPRLDRDDSLFVDRSGARAVVLAFGISGCLALAYEVLWTRYLIFVVGENSVYAFATMLAAILIGIALGSFLAALVADRVRDRVALLGGVFVLLGATAATTLVLMQPLAASTRLASTGEGFWLDSGLRFLKCLAVLLVPTTLSGSTFAIVARIYARDHAHLGRDAGRAYAVNTLGAIGGAALGGFWLLPRFGLFGGICILSGANVLLGMWLLLRPRIEGRAVATAAVTGACAAAAAVGIWLLPSSPEEVLRGREGWGQEIVFHEDGPESTVTVMQDPVNGQLFIQVDGEGQAGTDRLMQLHLRLLGHLPALFHPNPKTGLVVAFGAGITTGCLAQHDFERIDLVELSPSVIRASTHFKDWNHDPIPYVREGQEHRREGARVQLIVDDGRNFLLGTERSYDVITTDPIDADDAGTTSLYCKEYYDLVREHLRDGGLVCQWIMPDYGEAGFHTLLRTFQSVFPNTAVWHAGFTTVVVGFKDEPVLGLEDLRRKIEQPAVRDSLAFVGIDGAETLMSLKLLGPREVRALVGEPGPGRPLNTDDRPRIEYLRSGARSEGADRSTPWRQLIEERNADHGDWLVGWGPEQVRACARSEAWMQDHLAALRIELGVAANPRAGSTAEPHSAGVLAAGSRSGEADPDAAYLATAPEREAREAEQLDLWWKILTEHAPPVFLLMAGIDEEGFLLGLDVVQRARYETEFPMGLLAMESGRLEAAAGIFGALAIEIPGALRPALLEVACRDVIGDSVGALELALAMDAEWIDEWFALRLREALMARLLGEMEGDESGYLGRRLLTLTPADGSRPAARTSRAGPGALSPRPSTESAGDADAWRLWWRDARADLRAFDGRWEWSQPGG